MMEKIRTPLKGKPFSSLSNEELKEYMRLFQKFIFCFKHEDKEKEALMREVWKMLSDEDIDRWDCNIEDTPSNVPKLKRRVLVKKR